MIQRAFRLLLKHLSLLQRGTGKMFQRICMYRSPKAFYFQIEGRWVESTSTSCHYSYLQILSFYLINLYIYLKLKCLNQLRLCLILDPKSHILDKTSVSQGSTIRSFTLKLLALVMISAVQIALLRGDTKMMSIYLFYPVKEGDNLKAQACPIPYLLSGQSINCLLKCSLHFYYSVLFAQSGYILVMRLNSDQAWRITQAQRKPQWLQKHFSPNLHLPCIQQKQVWLFFIQVQIIVLPQKSIQK